MDLFGVSGGIGALIGDVQSDNKRVSGQTGHGVIWTLIGGNMIKEIAGVVWCTIVVQHRVAVLTLNNGARW